VQPCANCLNFIAGLEMGKKHGSRKQACAYRDN
jgi:hypothetical protein